MSPEQITSLGISILVLSALVGLLLLTVLLIVKRKLKKALEKDYGKEV